MFLLKFINDQSDNIYRSITHFDQSYTITIFITQSRRNLILRVLGWQNFKTYIYI